MKNIFEQSNEKQLPLFSLEADVCQKLQDCTKKNVPSFNHFCRLTFRQFLEKNHLYFDLQRTSNHETLVSIRRAKRNKCSRSKQKAKSADSGSSQNVTRPPDLDSTPTTEENLKQLEDPGEESWRKVRSKRTCKQDIKTEKDELQVFCKNVQEASENQRSKEDLQDERFIKELLQTPMDNFDKVFFVRSEEQYRNDNLKCTLDIVSLWNTPNRDRVFIVIGVQAKSKQPHKVVGLRQSREEDFFPSLFHSELFQLQPRFSYKEFDYSGKLIGVITIESNYGQGFPCLVMTNDKAPRLLKDQLWARKERKNVLISPSDIYTSHIHAWFLKVTKHTKKRPKDSTQEQASPPGLDHLPSDASCPMPRSDSCAQDEESGNLQSTDEQGATDELQKLIKALDFFRKGHFVLMCGSLNTQSQNVEVLSNAPWLAVYDFDFRGRDAGLLGVLEDSIKTQRNLSVLTWCDPHRSLRERGTQWWSMRGRRDVPDSIIADKSYTHVEWFKRVRGKVEQLCVELARFSEDCAVLTFLILWPASETEGSCIQKFLSRLQDYEHLEVKIALCYTDFKTDPSSNMDIQMIQRDFGKSLQVFRVSLRDICTEVKRLVGNSTSPPVYRHTLPAAESGTATISEKDAVWLKEDLDVLYLQSPHITLTADDLKKEAENFFRGGTINWYVWYDIGSNYLDVERSISKELIDHIRDLYINDCKTGAVTLFHAPGSGGSTMAQQVLWNLRDKAPCVQVKRRSGSSMEELADRLIFLHCQTHLPVVVLLDGEDEPRLKSLSKQLARNTVVMLNVKRFTSTIPESGQKSNGESKFYLSGIVKKQESRNLVLRFSERCENDQVKMSALTKLDEDVQEERDKHQMYEYGMTVYHHEFKGVRAYVRGYLQLDKNPGKELQRWQKCLAFLSLVYYYGQTSLPGQFFTSLLGKPSNYTVEMEDFAHEARMFIVQDVNAGKGLCFRICHYFVAKEVLEQILNRNFDRQQNNLCSTERLSKGARRNLKDFCIEFINHAVKGKAKKALTGHTTTYILAKTFIFRDYREMSAIETQESHTLRKSQFSQIMTDLDSDPPYYGRVEVLEKLCAMFPDDPNFRAHLGRFYTCCRPEEEDKAEKHFTEALRLCHSRRDSTDQYELEERSKLTLMRIYHMYGSFFQARLAKDITSRKDIATLSGDPTRLQKLLEEIVLNACRACDNFVLCRDNTPGGHEENYTYSNEIHVRLQICDFVKKFYPGQMQAFLSRRNQGPIYEFVRESVTEIEDLIMECYNVVYLDNVLHLQKQVHWFNELFRGCTTELKHLARDDDLTSLRMNITAKKLQYRDPDNIVSVESTKMPHAEVENLVKMLEDIFHHENLYRDNLKSKLELDYKDWILAIRNPNFQRVSQYSEWVFIYLFIYLFIEGL